MLLRHRSPGFSTVYADQSQRDCPDLVNAAKRGQHPGDAASPGQALDLVIGMVALTSMRAVGWVILVGVGSDNAL